MIAHKGLIWKKFEEFDSVESQSNFTPNFSDLVRPVISNNGIKTTKNHSEAINLRLFILEKIDQYS